MRERVLEAEHILDGSWAQSEEEVTPHFRNTS